jgi:hypothetical protein
MEPDSNKKRSPDKSKLSLKYVETADKKDEDRSWFGFAIDPLTNLNVMPKVANKLRGIKKGKAQPLKAGQIEYATIGGSARVLGGTTFWGGTIDARVLWGKFGGKEGNLMKDLSTRTGLEVELLNPEDIEATTISIGSKTSIEEDIGEVIIQTITCNGPLAEAAGVSFDKIETGLTSFQWKKRDGNDSEYAAICMTDTANTIKQLKKMIGDNPLVHIVEE